MATQGVYLAEACVEAIGNMVGTRQHCVSGGGCYLYQDFFGTLLRSKIRVQLKSQFWQFGVIYSNLLQIYRVACVFTAIYSNSYLQNSLCIYSNLQSSLYIYSDLLQICKVACVFVANRRKSPQTAEIATYAGFADPNFRLQQRAQKKFPDVINLFIMINILLYSYSVIGSFNFSNFTIKFYNITSYSLLTNLTNYNNLYSLYLLNLFL